MLKKSWINLLLIFLPLVAGVVELILINTFAQALPPFMMTADFGVFAFVFGMIAGPTANMAKLPVWGIVLSVLAFA